MKLNLEVVEADGDTFRAFLCRLLGCGLKPHGKTKLNFSFGLPQLKQKVLTMIEVTISNEQQVLVTLKPVTATGKPAKLDGKPSWTVAAGSSTLNVAEDGLSAMLISSNDPGTSEILVKADADLGEGVEEVSDTISLVVTGANAKSLGLVVGTPEAKPEAPPI